MDRKIKKARNRRKLSVKRSIRNSNRPRLSVFRSNKHIYAQIIDDNSGKTLVSASDLKIDDKMNKVERAGKVGEDIAKKALKKKIKEVVFDRSFYKYHGRIRALAESARKAGLNF